LYGLGGIGKTRLAVEHAWVFGYQAAFFVRADTPAGLRTGLAALARADLLNLGRALITSRLRSWPPWVHTQPLDTIPLEEARDFLLKRTDGHRRTAPDDADRALDLAEKLDGLPLALEQAGAYIVHTRLSFSKYLEVWEKERQQVLEWHDEAVMGYPASVAVTWKTSFDRLKPTTATLLRLCAFLAPDPIPEEMFETEKEIVESACELLRSETGQKDGVGSIPDRSIDGPVGSLSTGEGSLRRGRTVVPPVR
jgi:hypothetical protein